MKLDEMTRHRKSERKEQGKVVQRNMTLRERDREKEDFYIVKKYLFVMVMFVLVFVFVFVFGVVLCFPFPFPLSVFLPGSVWAAEGVAGRAGPSL